MLKHLNEKEQLPKRVIILGSNGFVGATTFKLLERKGIQVLGIGRNQIDLCSKEAAEKLASILQPEDALVITSAKAPCKNHSMLLENIQMMNAVCDALIQKPVAHVIYVSSDAVYADSMSKLNESSPAAPTSLHGAMHMAREKMLESVVKANQLAILRPSLLYGANDPHNGYGPNRFYRLVQAGKTIELFGNGEEERDHVYIEDVAEIISLCLTHKSHGILNITTGEVHSFHQIALQLGDLFKQSIDIKCLPRNMPMPHNGYRAFDISVCRQAFSNFQFTPLHIGLTKMHQQAS